MTNPMATTAIAYAHLGIAVFPLQVREKKPLGGTTGLKAASADPVLTEARWRGVAPIPPNVDWTKGPIFARPACNIGVATGPISGFWVLDLDGPEAAAALAALEARHGALPLTVEQATGNGRHLCFAWDPDRPVRNMNKRSRELIGAGIDVRGEGGYIVAPPSVHPSGRIYTWRDGHAPNQRAFAAAPAWLMDLVAPIAPVSEVARPKPPPRPVTREGSATRYGAVALDRACRQIASAPAGRQDDTLYDTACSIGRLVHGGEIELRHAFDLLVHAGLSMTPHGRPWIKREVEGKVERAFTWAVDHPKSAPERSATRAAEPRRAQPSATPAAELASASSEAERLWREARSPWVTAAGQWFEDRGLNRLTPALPGAYDETFRALPDVPWGKGRRGAALVCRMRRPDEPETAASALAVLPLHPRAQGFSNFIGDVDGRAVVIGAPHRRPIIVASALQDAWALGQRCDPSEAVCLVIAPTHAAMFGGALGDKYGRVDSLIPRADPARPPWRLPDRRSVFLAVRGDIAGPELKARGARGGTHTMSFSSDAAARFWGSVAEQHWRAAMPDGGAANAVRLLRPNVGRNGFNPGSGST